MNENFKAFKLNKQLEENLNKLKYLIPTPIQAKGIPIILEKKNFLGLAQTGTGKTATFVLPILNQFLMEKESDNYVSKKSHPKALILAPTRELCTQIGKSIESYARNCNISHLVCFGGVSSEPQIEALTKEVDILVATPQRLLDLVTQKNVFLDNLEFFVIDEVDNILEIGLNSVLKDILKKLPKEGVQKLFFSATLNAKIKSLSKDLMKDFEKVEVESENIDLKLVEQRVMYTIKEHKIKTLLSILKEKEIRRAIIFTNTKSSVDTIVRKLGEENISCWGLHSGKSNTHREKAVLDFRLRKIKFLVATDLAARGLDFEDVSCVINYEIAHEPELYIHRVGRVGRAKKKGISITLCSIEERNLFKKVEEIMKYPIKTVMHDLHSNAAKSGGKNSGGSGKKFRPKKKKMSSNSGFNNRKKKR